MDIRVPYLCSITQLKSYSEIRYAIERENEVAVLVKVGRGGWGGADKCDGRRWVA